MLAAIPEPQKSYVGRIHAGEVGEREMLRGGRGRQCEKKTGREQGGGERVGKAEKGEKIDRRETENGEREKKIEKQEV